MPSNVLVQRNPNLRFIYPHRYPPTRLLSSLELKSVPSDPRRLQIASDFLRTTGSALHYFTKLFVICLLEVRPTVPTIFWSASYL